MTRFSVVVPAYNAASFVERALDSVDAQTFGDFEVVVVDDGSTDATRDAVERWARDHPARSLHLAVHERNRRIGAARNTGARRASGEFVAFLDADDRWAPTKLLRVDEVLRERPATDLLCHDVWIDDGVATSYQQTGPHVTYADLLFRGNCIVTSATVVRRSVFLDVGGFSEDVSFDSVEDYDLWMRLARAGARLDYLHEPLGTYTSHGGGVSSDVLRHWRHGMNVLESHWGAWSEWTRGRRLARRRTRGDYRRRAWKDLRRRGDRAAARAVLWPALIEDPLAWKNWAAAVVSLVR